MINHPVAVRRRRARVLKPTVDHPRPGAGKRRRAGEDGRDIIDAHGRRPRDGVNLVERFLNVGRDEGLRHSALPPARAVVKDHELDALHGVLLDNVLHRGKDEVDADGGDAAASAVEVNRNGERHQLIGGVAEGGRVDLGRVPDAILVVHRQARDGLRVVPGFGRGVRNHAVRGGQVGLWKHILGAVFIDQVAVHGSIRVIRAAAVAPALRSSNVVGHIGVLEVRTERGLSVVGRGNKRACGSFHGSASVLAACAEIQVRPAQGGCHHLKALHERLNRSRGRLRWTRAVRGRRPLWIGQHHGRLNWHQG